MKKIKLLISNSIFFLGIMSFVSCNKFLDVMPDNRTVLDSEEKIQKLLVSAYPQTAYMMAAELSSDNVDDYGVGNPNSQRILEEVFRWHDVRETGSDAPASVWEDCYAAIASANEALSVIEDRGSPVSLNSHRGEALVARAYSHFILVNMFAMHYTNEHATTDLGVPYIFEPGRTLDPKYERHSVKEVYDFIKQDLEEGIPLINDALYGGTPKYHMNKAAAYAFAARVALYTQDWQEAARYASLVLGSNPRNIMRDNSVVAAVSATLGTASIAFTGSTNASNLFLATANSSMGTYFGAYYTGSRFSHGQIINLNETFFATTPWGKTTSSTAYTPRLFIYTGTDLDKALVPRVTYMFEMIDPVNQIGFARTSYAPFTAEETLLVRAEANIHLKKYDEAFADMRIWLSNNYANVPANFSIERINEWATDPVDDEDPGVRYYTPTAPTAKKRLNPEFQIEAGTQENMLHALLLMRRLETIHVGLRWFDIKRYGIEVTRRVITGGDGSTTIVGSTEEATKLTVRDKRQALQIPQDVIAAGLTPNRQ